jgi:hypothetical protein
VRFMPGFGSYGFVLTYCKNMRTGVVLREAY